MEPGFNSGWIQVQGMSVLNNNEFNLENENGEDSASDGLVDFDGKGKYSDPEFVWSVTLGPTALIFLHSDQLETTISE